MSRSSKRPSVIDTVIDDLAGAGEEPVTGVANVVALQGAEPAAKAAAKPKPIIKARPDVQHTSIYVPKVAYRKIREIAMMGDRRAHDVIMEGVDLVLAKYGFPGIAELKKDK